MAIVPRKRKKHTTFYAVFSDTTGKRVWERSGADRREAERLERRRLREVEAGTYRRGATPTTKFGVFLCEWAARRRNRNAEEDLRQIERYLIGPDREWLMTLPCEDVRVRHSIQLVEELKATVSAKTGKPLGEKYISNLYGLYSSACRAARIAELMPVDPCVLPRGLLRRKARKGTRSPYRAQEVARVVRMRSLEGVFGALVLLSGMREGEACGRRWRDWDRESAPLGCLSVTTQYDDQPLKTDRSEDGEHARKVPVHPELAAALEWWWSEGFELWWCRKPTLDDFIVPRTAKGEPHTRSSAYKFWTRHVLPTAQVTNLSLHSTRHTFITLARRGGARQELVEQVTHNAAGTIVDQYTHWDWQPLCEAVLCLRLAVDASVDASAGTPEKQVEAPGIEPCWAGPANPRNLWISQLFQGLRLVG